MENMEKGKSNSEKIWTMQKKIEKWFGKYGRKVSWNVKWYGKYKKKASRIVKRYGKYRRKVSGIVKRYEKYGMNLSWIVKRFGQCKRKLRNDLENMEER
jgi:hypothetical protein